MIFKCTSWEENNFLTQLVLPQTLKMQTLTGPHSLPLLSLDDVLMAGLGPKPAKRQLFLNLCWINTACTEIECQRPSALAELDANIFSSSINYLL